MRRCVRSVSHSMTTSRASEVPRQSQRARSNLNPLINRRNAHASRDIHPHTRDARAHACTYLGLLHAHVHHGGGCRHVALDRVARVGVCRSRAVIRGRRLARARRLADASHTAYMSSLTHHACGGASSSSSTASRRAFAFKSNGDRRQRARASPGTRRPRVPARAKTRAPPRAPVRSSASPGTAPKGTTLTASPARGEETL